MKDIFWVIPDNLGLEERLKSSPPSFKYQIDYFYHIIDSICRGSDLEDLDNNAGFVNLNARRMQEFNHAYKRYISYLLNADIVKSDRLWVKAKKSTGFKLNPMKAFSTNMIKVRIKNSTCRKKMFAQARNNNKRANIVFPALTKWFNNLLQIDIVGATKKVEELFPSPTGGIRGPLRYFRGKKNAPDVGSKKFKALYAIHRFANKDFYFNIDDNVGRFHSNLTNIKRELRHFITYDGQKLVNIDIKSAQPVFSTLLLSKVFYQKSEARLSIFSFPVINSVLQSPLTSKSLSSSYMMLVKTLQYIDIQCIEYYCSLVYSGEFYEKLLKLIYRDKKVTKSQVKVDVYRVFFSKNRSNNPFKTNFKNLFPDVYRVFALFKRKDHTCLSRLLQSIESKIMIEYVAVRVAHERPEIPIFTIHDSMATTVGNEGYLIQVIKEEAFRLTGLKLKVGVEYWG